MQRLYAIIGAVVGILLLAWWVVPNLGRMVARPDPTSVILAGNLEAARDFFVRDPSCVTNQYSMGHGIYYTPLQLAAANKKPEICALILGMGADPRQAGKGSESPLHIAVSGNCLACVEHLL